MKHVFPLALLLVLAFAGSSLAERETRNVDPFESIAMNGAAVLKIDVGSRESLRIEGDEALVRGTVIEVRDKTLYIDNHRLESVSGNMAPLTIYITLPLLNALDLHGGTDTELTGLDGGALKLTVEGAGRIKARGHLGQLEVALKGASDADCDDLAVDDVDATVYGVGHMRLQVHRSLNATVNGVGSIEYSGDPPQVVPVIHGVGSIVAR